MHGDMLCQTIAFKSRLIVSFWSGEGLALRHKVNGSKLFHKQGEVTKLLSKLTSLRQVVLFCCGRDSKASMLLKQAKSSIHADPFHLEWRASR